MLLGGDVVVVVVATMTMIVIIIITATMLMMSRFHLCIEGRQREREDQKIIRFNGRGAAG
jgi:hypothetical protein